MCTQQKSVTNEEYKIVENGCVRCASCLHALRHACHDRIFFYLTGGITQYITYRFFENPYIHEDKPSVSVCTLVYVFPWCSGEVWGCALVSSLSISRIGSLKIHTSMRTNHLSVFALWCILSFHGVRERCGGVRWYFTQYISYRFFENPHIHEDKPSLSICTLVYPVFPWCAGEVWGVRLYRYR